MTAGLPQANKSLFHKPDLFTLFTLIVGYRQHLRVVGTSMEGTLKEGDLITFKKLNPKNIDLEIGDIVVASHPKTKNKLIIKSCLLYTSPSPRDKRQSRMPSSA